MAACITAEPARLLFVKTQETESRSSRASSALPERQCASALCRRLSYPQLIQHEGVVLRHFPVAAEAARLAAVAGFHIGAEQHRQLAGIEVAQLGHVLGRLPVLHLRIPQ